PRPPRPPRPLGQNTEVDKHTGFVFDYPRIRNMKFSIAAFLSTLLVATSSFAQQTEIIRNWPTYPEGTSLGSLHGDMAADSQGNVYVATGGTIQVIGADGVFKHDLGKDWGGVHGMKLRKEGGEEFLFTAQTGRKTVSKLKLDGTVIWKIIGHPAIEGMYEHISKYNPTDVDVAPDGTVYIVDGYGQSLVHVYDKEQKYVKTFGGKGKENGKFDVCHNILVDTRSDELTLLISDRQNNRLQLHGMDGTFIKTIDAELRQPCAADLYGSLLAVGELGGRLSLYDKNNNLVARLGDEPKDRKKGHGTPPEDWINGALIGVHGCTFDSKGDLYAQEYSKFGRVVKYRIKSLIENYAELPATSGNWVFDVVENWPVYPEGVSLGSLHGDMAADSNGNVYIATGGTIQVIRANGSYKGDLGKAWGGVHGMKVRRQGGEEFLFTAQNGRKAVSKLKLDGTVIWKILGPPEVVGMYEHISKYNPTDVDIAPDGTIYVVDGYGKSLVHVYDKDQQYVKTFGGKGTEDGKFNVCHNILVDTRGDQPTLLISDRENNRLTEYAMDGTFLKTIDTELRQPCAADIYAGLLAVGELGGRLSLYDRNNKLVARIGDDPRGRAKGNGAPPKGWHLGALVAVHGCTFDSNGDLYAQEWNKFGRMVKYRINW
ncbi:MAG: DNA-binding beta-propeller fold protein YncE, partial [Verrucomicrobiales bacterium]